MRLHNSNVNTRPKLDYHYNNWNTLILVKSILISKTRVSVEFSTSTPSLFPESLVRMTTTCDCHLIWSNSRPPHDSASVSSAYLINVVMQLNWDALRCQTFPTVVMTLFAFKQQFFSCAFNALQHTTLLKLNRIPLILCLLLNVRWHTLYNITAHYFLRLIASLVPAIKSLSVGEIKILLLQSEGRTKWFRKTTVREMIVEQI